MLYLLDANTFINAKDYYYPFDMVPEYWEWIEHQGELQNIKIPNEIYGEINGGNQRREDYDELAIWARQDGVKERLLLDDTPDIALVNKVITEGYVSHPTEADLLKMGQDPFLIAYALKDKNNMTIVTTEASKPSKQGANKHIPDVCKHFGISCCNTFQMTRTLGFSTNWKSSF